MKNSLPKPYRVFLFVFPLKYGLLDFPLDPLSSVAPIYTFSSSCFFRHRNPLFSTRLDLCSSATHHRFRFSSSHRTLCFGRLAGCEEKLSPKLAWTGAAKTHKKNRNHMNCLTAARTPREINTKFQSHKNVPIAQTHDQREETFNSTSLAYFSS